MQNNHLWIYTKIEYELRSTLRKGFLNILICVFYERNLIFIHTIFYNVVQCKLSVTI